MRKNREGNASALRYVHELFERNRVEFRKVSYYHVLSYHGGGMDFQQFRCSWPRLVVARLGGGYLYSEAVVLDFWPWRESPR